MNRDRTHSRSSRGNRTGNQQEKVHQKGEKLDYQKYIDRELLRIIKFYNEIKHI